MAAAPAVQARLDAIKNVTSSNSITKADLLDAVKALRPLGRTARWVESVDRWAELVESKFDEAPMWALHQPAVWAANAAL